MIIIGITGLIGSGKNAAAEYLISQHNFKHMSFAGTLKDAVSAIFGWDRDMLEGLTPEARAQREVVDEWWSNRLSTPNITPRWVLQRFGTEVCRRNFHEDIWVASVENQIQKSTQNIVISDCRFSNEINVIKGLGGSTIRVERGENPDWYSDAVLLNAHEVHDSVKDHAKARLERNGIHASEYSSVGLDYDYFVNNNGTLVQLYQQLDSIVNL